jgi:hypothetical protein
MSAVALRLLDAARARGWPSLREYTGMGPGGGERGWLAWLQGATTQDVQRCERALHAFAEAGLAYRAQGPIHGGEGAMITTSTTHERAEALRQRLEADDWPSVLGTAGERAWHLRLSRADDHDLRAVEAELEKQAHQAEEDRKRQEMEHLDRAAAGLEPYTEAEQARINQLAIEEHARAQAWEAGRMERIEGYLERIANALAPSRR